MNDRVLFLVVGVVIGAAIGVLVRELRDKPPGALPPLAVVGVPIPHPPAPRLDFGGRIAPPAPTARERLEP